MHIWIHNWRAKSKLLFCTNFANLTWTLAEICLVSQFFIDFSPKDKILMIIHDMQMSWFVHLQNNLKGKVKAFIWHQILSIYVDHSLRHD